MRLNSYKDLNVWKMSMDLVDIIYEYTEKFPNNEQFSLARQMRRCSVSIPSNIAEGSGRTGKKELAHHLSISRGSLCELNTQAIIASRRKYINDQELEKIEGMCETIGKMLTKFIQSLKS